ncbi:MAG TPA: DMT family transporter [Nitrospirales bacterium]|nr:DMT family transporter [Nitrospirales bacterium]HIB53354.1 DMT family transporter [Nitrospirales bacterium]HIC04395.1 DMT family transporter [Nitrospirales bacterium]HIO20964.1 DMT family transporter [Nitrospirales bacterium]
MNNLIRAGLYVIASSLAFASMGALIKQTSADIPNETLVFFRNVVALLILTPWVLARGFATLNTRVFSLHVLRSAAGLTAMYCYFFALASIPLAEAVILHMTAPLFIPIIAWIWLKEPASSRTKWAIGIGYIGILLILKPGSGIFTFVALFALASGLFASIAMVCIRRMAATEPPLRIVWYFTLISTVISTIPLLWTWHIPEPSMIGTLVLIGALATLGQLLLTRGYTLAPAGQVGGFAYSEVVFGFTLGWIVWNELPDSLSVIGILTVCSAGMLILSHARR